MAAVGRGCCSELGLVQATLGVWAKCLRTAHQLVPSVVRQRQLLPLCDVVETCLLLQPLLLQLRARLAHGGPATPQAAAFEDAGLVSACRALATLGVVQLVEATQQQILVAGGGVLANAHALSAVCRSALKARICLHAAQSSPGEQPLVRAEDIPFWPAMLAGAQACAAVVGGSAADQDEVTICDVAAVS
jgi:hypothetical protein